ncbi:MAG: oligoendopeptidase F, partial [Spirochaetales bacterium]|nr:oligoendopeptidase F [Candidatus Physcosoma equi]
LMSIEDDKIEAWLKEERFADFRVSINKTRRMKAHVLSAQEERILSLHSANSGTFQQTFMDIDNIDLDFGEVDGEKLTHSTWSKFMNSTDEKVREKAYKQYYKEYEKHQHVIARIYEGSVKNDIFSARARGYASSLERALYPDNMPKEVYTSLIQSVHDAFPVLHRYYALRAKLLGKTKLKHYDVYTPMVKAVNSRHTYEEAVAIIKEAVKPLGEDYSQILVKGLLEDRWVDRYENKGKRSGAFSAGCFTGNPYILTNYEEEVLHSVFTLIHEGGHSMHSYFSAHNNPFPCYNYTIFEAEVASTFNENLLQNYLLKNAKSKEEEAYLLANNLDSIVATFFRQTMFAEFELLIHEAAENDTPITVDFMRKTYRGLLESYFGPTLEFEDNSDMEGLRIPHFYRAFYVYKYATGIAASIALSQRVLNGGEQEKQDYLTFLKSGGSRYPLEALRVAGVDMAKPDAVKAAAEYFGKLLDRLEEITG